MPRPAPKPKPVTPAKTTVPSPAVARQAVAAAQAAAVPPSPVPKVWQPWVNVITAAEQRMRGRITMALHQMEIDMARAGEVLDSAEQGAKEASGAILAAAYARLHQDLTAASDAAAAIMGPARQTYDQLVAQAGSDFDQALADATASYQAEMSRAQTAQQLAAAMPDPAAAAAAQAAAG